MSVFLYGMQAVKEALKNKKRKIHGFWCIESKYKEMLDWQRQCDLNFKIDLIDRKTLDKEFPDQIHQGIVIEIEPLIDELTALQPIPSKNKKIILMDQVQDLRNIGAIIRSAAAFGFEAVVFSENAQCPNLIERKNYGQIGKAAAGGLEYVKLVIVKNLSQAMEKLKEQGYWLIGLDENETDLSVGKEFEHLCLVIGQEGEGLRALTKKNCDIICGIKTKANFSCLNASVAASIAMCILAD